MIWGWPLVQFAIPGVDMPGRSGTFVLRWGGRSICQTWAVSRFDTAELARYNFGVACGLWSYGCHWSGAATVECTRDSQLTTRSSRQREKARAAGDPFFGDQWARNGLRFQRKRCKELMTLKPGQLWVQPPPARCPPWLMQELAGR